jgi:DNA-binding NarL/FixJ family response regulator
MRILLADDHVMVRQGLKFILEREGMRVIAEASDGRDAVRFARELNPDVAVVDLAMPLLNGLDAAGEILAATARTRVVLLTMHSEERYVLEALRRGITGYVLKSRAAGGLVEAVHEVARGSIYLSPGISKVVVSAFLGQTHSTADPLTPRERQVLQLIAEGKATKQIAGLLGVSVKTAESHRARIMSKLEIRETAGLVRYAIRTGLIEP